MEQRPTSLCYTIVKKQVDLTPVSGSEPDEDTEEFLELQEKLKNPEKMTR